MDTEQQLMAALHELASVLEVDISELMDSIATLGYVISTLLEKDEHFFSYFYTNNYSYDE